MAEDSSQWDIFGDWTIDSEQFKDTSEPGLADWSKVFEGHLKALLSLITALVVTAVEVPFRGAVQIYDGARSFAVDVVDVVIAVVEQSIQGSFAAAGADLSGGGPESFVAAILFMSLGYLAITMVVRFLE